MAYMSPKKESGKLTLRRRNIILTVNGVNSNNIGEADAGTEYEE